MDPDPLRFSVRFNSEWLGNLDFTQVIELAAKQTVARMLERDDFRARYRAGTPISIHEFLYPLAQAYDSVAIGADVELGGTDQTFNLLLGREIQGQFGQPSQVILTMPLLIGIDGAEKMSKSLDNYIGFSEAPEVMFPKLMRVPDVHLESYVRFLTDLDVQATLALGAIEAHRVLARAIVEHFHGPSGVQSGEARYDQVAGGTVPSVMPSYAIPRGELDSKSEISLVRVMVLVGLAESNSDARRLIEGKGVKVDGRTVADTKLTVKMVEPVVLQRGKDKFVRVSAEQ